ncbi:UNVERIFIED_CONTAM: hypothetical protein FKN15_017137 [Acipenser sinensis]
MPPGLGALSASASSVPHHPWCLDTPYICALEPWCFGDLGAQTLPVLVPSVPQSFDALGTPEPPYFGTLGAWTLGTSVALVPQGLSASVLSQP